MRHGLGGLSIYMLKGLRKEDEHPAYVLFGVYGTFTFSLWTCVP